MADYTNDFHRLAARTNLEESEEQLAARFVSGLKEKIQNKMAVNPQYNLMRSINLAEHLEKQLAKCTSYSFGASSSKTGEDKEKGLLRTPKGKEPLNETGQKSTAPYDPSMINIKCYRRREWVISPMPVPSAKKLNCVKAMCATGIQIQTVMRTHLMRRLALMKVNIYLV